MSTLVPMPPETAANVAAIYARGRELGRDPNAFSKLGDSTILNPHFLGPFDEGAYNLGDFGYLQPTIDRWRGSFKRHGVGAHFGLHSWTVFDPMWADEKWCEPGEHLLACELRLQNPSVLFVRLGSNDSGSPSGFRFNVRDVIKYAIENGVIPIIGTKADRFEGSNENNEILRELAAEYHVPLWDFDLLAGTLPGRGLDKDNIHLVIDDLPHDYTLPETFQRGHPMQDLSALIALDQVRRIIEDTN
ncbi:MAG TPA: SGNH/GDSL hydrolase family protein [Promineifilum sp.]|nr:SGNH/GDSL hydrolase family protein [Promineifilum sp.]HRO88999.1 SGNH/GDSL hydrolase family protein [Promineifilum sp.]HRQ13497.1 SGNH/GDSL hydrolase family protein [Promineifilum sp.]